MTNLKITVYKRLLREKRWNEAMPIRDQLMKQARAGGMTKEEAQEWAYAELDKLFPPANAVNQSDQPQTSLPNQRLDDNLNQEPAKTLNDEQDVKQDAKFDDEQDGKQDNEEQDGKQGDVAVHVISDDAASLSSSLRSRAKDAELSVTGLGELPATWPDLPPNAPLSAEVSWVQANRLRCVRETPERVVVDLSRALNPAPSYAALGWLETSIKTYAKFVDVAAKATASNDGEQAEIRREQQSIDEVRRLLAEMLDG